MKAETTHLGLDEKDLNEEGDSSKKEERKEKEKTKLIDIDFKIKKAHKQSRDVSGNITGQEEDAVIDLEELNAVIDGRQGDHPIPSQAINVLDILLKQSVY